MKDVIIGLFIIFSFLCMCFLGLAYFHYIIVENACETWKIESERESKFISNYPWYADCLTKTESGWISATHLYQQETPNLK